MATFYKGSIAPLPITAGDTNFGARLNDNLIKCSALTGSVDTLLSGEPETILSTDFNTAICVDGRIVVKWPVGGTLDAPDSYDVYVYKPPVYSLLVWITTEQCLVDLRNPLSPLVITNPLPVKVARYVPAVNKDSVWVSAIYSGFKTGESLAIFNFPQTFAKTTLLATDASDNTKTLLTALAGNNFAIFTAPSDAPATGDVVFNFRAAQALPAAVLKDI